MNWKKWLLVGLACTLSGSTALAHGGVSIGIGLGFPICPRPYYAAPYYYPYAYPYYYAPVVVQPAPVVVQPTYAVQPAPVAQTAPTVPPPPVSVTSQPGPSPTGPAPTVSAFQPMELQKPAEVGQLFQLLNDPSEKTRSDAVIQLGRLKLNQAVDPLCATLAGDKSAVVRESAARALGLICASRSLTALMHAAQADPDNDVRRSASFAVEIIKLNNNLK